MATDKVIPNVIDVAEGVAKIIFEHSYRSYFSETNRVNDLLLFGSALTGTSYNSGEVSEPHDIDLLVIHDLFELNTYGLFTVYDEGELKCVPDPEGDITKQRYDSSSILESMGSRQVPDFLEARDKIFNSFRGWVLQRREDNEPIWGNVDLPYLGEIEIEEGDFKSVYDQVRKLYHEKVEQEGVGYKAAKFLEGKGLEVREVLDLIVMNRNLLHPEKAQEDRELAIQQSKDPTFWYTIFSEGKLYDHVTETFSVSVEDKYPGTLELFKP